jgi:flagellar motor switch protein FliM
MQSSRPTDSRTIVTYDFKHPSQVSKDQLRTLENLHSNLARTMASSFSALQRSVVDCDIAFVDQTTYAEFIMSLSNPSCSYTFGIEPLGGPAIIDFSLPVAYSFIDRQFGGAGGNPPTEGRPMTAIERNVMGKVVTRTLEDLEAVWEPLMKIQVSDAELETNPEFMQAASASDTVVLIAFEVNSQHASGLVNLCYPYFTLEPVMGFLTVQTWATRTRGVRDNTREERLEQLDRVYAPVRVELGRVDVSMSEILDLQAGDVLQLDTPLNQDAIVYVGVRPKYKARPGLVGKRRSVQLTEPIVKADETIFMTEVEKTDANEL